MIRNFLFGKPKEQDPADVTFPTVPHPNNTPIVVGQAQTVSTTSLQGQNLQRQMSPNSPGPITQDPITPLSLPINRVRSPRLYDPFSASSSNSINSFTGGIVDNDGFSTRNALGSGSDSDGNVYKFPGQKNQDQEKRKSSLKTKTSGKMNVYHSTINVHGLDSLDNEPKVTDTAKGKRNIRRVGRPGQCMKGENEWSAHHFCDDCLDHCNKERNDRLAMTNRMRTRVPTESKGKSKGKPERRSISSNDRFRSLSRNSKGSVRSRSSSFSVKGKGKGNAKPGPMNPQLNGHVTRRELIDTVRTMMTNTGPRQFVKTYEENEDAARQITNHRKMYIDAVKINTNTMTIKGSFEAAIVLAFINIEWNSINTVTMTSVANALCRPNSMYRKPENHQELLNILERLGAVTGQRKTNRGAYRIEDHDRIAFMTFFRNIDIHCPAGAFGVPRAPIQLVNQERQPALMQQGLMTRPAPGFENVMNMNVNDHNTNYNNNTNNMNAMNYVNNNNLNNPNVVPDNNSNNVNNNFQLPVGQNAFPQGYTNPMNGAVNAMNSPLDVLHQVQETLRNQQNQINQEVLQNQQLQQQLVQRQNQENSILRAAAQQVQQNNVGQHTGIPEQLQGQRPRNSRMSQPRSNASI